MASILGGVTPGSRAELEAASRALCDAALAAGSADNVSCLTVLVEALPSETLSEAHSRLTRRTIPPAMEVGNRLDGWRVAEVLHASTRSHVYLVERPKREGRYVLKAPSANFADDLRYLEGFAVEQWVGRRIRNRQVMRILPGEDSRFLYFVAEYVEGATLRQWMADHPEPALDEILPLVRSIVPAARVFHRMNIVHRDLKPENIMISADGTAKIIDFGSAQVTGFADLRSEPIADWPEGSLNYIAPELLTGGEAKPLSDLFSIAAITWEMLTGQLPFAREGAARISISEEDRLRGVFDRLRPDLPPAVEQVLQRALSHDPAKRPQAMSEFVGALARAGESAALMRTEFVPLIERGSKTMWRNWALIATLAALVLAVALFGRLV
jgi:protein phosphatase